VQEFSLLHSVQTGSGAQTASYPMGTGAAVEKVEGQRITVFEVIDTLNNLKNNLVSKSKDFFLSSAVRTILGKLEKERFGPEVAKFRQYVHTFYQTAVEYLCKWTSSLENLQAFCWVTLRIMPHWEEIIKTVEFVRKVTPSFDIDNNVLCDEFVCIKQYVNLEKLTE
jgi:hypothetical protein